jgi:tRNA threonylcarbamoyladenosine biosynthesis protein TsaE
MEQLGADLAALVTAPFFIYLQGDLGAGKTTFTRGFIHAKGHQGAVKSPTYTLVEPYEFDDARVFHMDLYRLADASELDFIGIRDIEAEDSIAIVEWPDRGRGNLPQADLIISIDIEGDRRRLGMTSVSNKAEQVLMELAKKR